MQFTTLLGIFGAATALAAPALQVGAETPRLIDTKPFEIDRLYMEMDSVWDTSYGVTIKFSITDSNTGINTFCNMTDVQPSTAYACTRDQTKWSLNIDFSKISVEWIWASGELVPASEAAYRANGATTVNWNCASSGSYGQQCFANPVSVPVQTISGAA